MAFPIKCLSKFGGRQKFTTSKISENPKQNTCEENHARHTEVKLMKIKRKRKS